MLKYHRPLSGYETPEYSGRCPLGYTEILDCARDPQFSRFSKAVQGTCSMPSQKVVSELSEKKVKDKDLT